MQTIETLFVWSQPNSYLQASVYLARSGKGNARRVKARSVHAPARRLARTTISLGPDEGIAFGLRAVRCSPYFVYLPRAILVPSSVSAPMPAHVHSIVVQGPMSSLHTVKFCHGLRAIDAQSWKVWRFFCLV